MREGYKRVGRRKEGRKDEKKVGGNMKEERKERRNRRE